MLTMKNCCPNDPILPFVDQSHEEFYFELLYDMQTYDKDTRIIVYLLGTCAATRVAFFDLYRQFDRYIVDDCWEAPWQTADTRRCIMLANNLTTGANCYHGLDPAHLFDSPLILCLQAAVFLASTLSDE